MGVDCQVAAKGEGWPRLAEESLHVWVHTVSVHGKRMARVDRCGGLSITQTLRSTDCTFCVLQICCNSPPLGASILPRSASVRDIRLKEHGGRASMRAVI